MAGSANQEHSQRINLAVLKSKHDPWIKEIVDTASQVALYTFNASALEWEKTEVEGSLFIYKRSASPLYGFMILNRLSTDNPAQPINRELEFQLQDSFLLYKTGKSIHGIWFYEQTDLVRIYDLITKLQSKSEAEPSAPPSQPPAPQPKKKAAAPAKKQAAVPVAKQTAPASKPAPKQPAVASTTTPIKAEGGQGQGVRGGARTGMGGSVDILQMLSKAQYEYEAQQSPKKASVDAGAGAGREAMSASRLIRPVPLKPGSDAPLPTSLLMGSEVRVPEPAYKQADLFGKVGGSGVLPAPEVNMATAASSMAATSSALIQGLAGKNTGTPKQQAGSGQRLLTPGEFKPRSALEPGGAVPAVPNGDADGTGSPMMVKPRIEPLTKEQLQQAMIHLLQNDSNFLKTLHEAYLKTLTGGL